MTNGIIRVTVDFDDYMQVVIKDNKLLKEKEK